MATYAEEHGFIGLGSEEGFESAHNRLKWIKTMLYSMPFAKDRGTKMGQRYQVSMLHEFEETWQLLNPTVQERSAYKAKSEAYKASKRVERLAEDDDSTTTPAGLVKLPSGNLIFETWAESFYFVSAKVAPKTMVVLFDSNPVLSGPKEHKLRDLLEYIS